MEYKYALFCTADANAWVNVMWITYVYVKKLQSET